ENKKEHQVIREYELTAIQSGHGEEFREIIQLMNSVVDMAAKFKEDFEEVKVQVKNIQGEMEMLNQEVKELKAEIAELQTSKCDKEEKKSLFLGILSKLFPKIRLEIFGIPLLDLRQTFSL
ncbi:hypothetical protein XELAEV_18045891mg, partial [Xenopus laevis]